MPMHKSGLQLLIVILVAFSFVISSVGVAASRRLLSSESGEGFPRLSTQTTPVQGLVDLRNEEEETEGRMDLESTKDYPGTGANNRHDPKTPARA